MNNAALSQVIRSFLPELAIGSACCAAGYFFLVDPIHGKLAAARAELDALTRSVAKAQSQPATGTDAARAETARATIDFIAARSALAADQAQLLQAVSNLGDTTRVRIEQFNPGAVRGPRSAPGQPAPKADAKVEQRTAFTISVTGTFADTARFVSSMQRDVGLTAIRGVRLIPAGTDKPDSISAIIETEHVYVNTKALAALQAGAPGSTFPGHTGQPGLPGPQASVNSENRQ